MSLFGSGARGGETPASDLDFLIELEAGRSLVDLVGVKQDLEAIFGRPVDAFTPASLKPAVLAAARADLVRVL
jgi:predicted nucleotidyltransferase